MSNHAFPINCTTVGRISNYYGADLKFSLEDWDLKFYFVSPGIGKQHTRAALRYKPAFIETW